MNKLFTVVAALLLSCNVYSQELTGSGGVESSNTTMQLDYSVGEVVVETTGSTTIAQGYQQPAITVTSIDVPEAASAISIYPNPAATMVNVSIEGAESIKEIALYNMAGQLVWSNSNMMTKLLEINLSDFDNGVYNLIITEEETTQTHQIIKTY